MNVIGIGTDIVKVSRFENWQHKSCRQLRRIFSEDELKDVFAESHLISQRFATRFAAKEALYKAFCYSTPNFKIPLITFCRHVSVKKGDKLVFIVDREILGVSYCNILLSISHAEEYAVAFVMMTGIHK